MAEKDKLTIDALKLNTALHNIDRVEKILQKIKQEIIRAIDSNGQ